MTTVVIDDKKQGAQEMLELLRVLGFVTSFEAKSKGNSVQMRRQNLINSPEKYDPLALAGAAEDSPLDLTQIRMEWKKK